MIKGIQKNIVLKNDVEANFFYLVGYGYEKTNNRTWLAVQLFKTEQSQTDGKPFINEGCFEFNFFEQDTFDILAEMSNGIHPEQAIWNKTLTKNNIQLRDGTICDFTQDAIQISYPAN